MGRLHENPGRVGDRSICTVYPPALFANRWSEFLLKWRNVKRWIFWGTPIKSHHSIIWLQVPPYIWLFLWNWYGGVCKTAFTVMYHMVSLSRLRRHKTRKLIPHNRKIRHKTNNLQAWQTFFFLTDEAAKNNIYGLRFNAALKTSNQIQCCTSLTL